MNQKMVLKILVLLFGLFSMGRGQEYNISSIIPDDYNPKMRPGNPFSHGKKEKYSIFLLNYNLYLFDCSDYVNISISLYVNDLIKVVDKDQV